MVVLVTASPCFSRPRETLWKPCAESIRKSQRLSRMSTTGRTALCWAASIRCSGAKATLWTGSAVVALKFRPAPFIRLIPFRLRSFMKKAIELADLTGKETVVDAYCGTGTIGMIAQKKRERYSVWNPTRTQCGRGRQCESKRCENIRFYREDAGSFLQSCAADNMPVDVVLMDPPRAGSSEEFLDAVAKIGPSASYMYPAIRRRWSATVPIWKNRATVQKKYGRWTCSHGRGR